MKKKLYLHIGVHRTATTNIQETLRLNFKHLLEQGYLYPYGVTRHMKLMNTIFSKKKSVLEVAKDIEHRSNGHPYPVHSIILSDEDVCKRQSLALLQDFGEVFDVKVVFALRRQDLWLESWWSQNVKRQWDRSLSNLPFGKFLNKRKQFHWIHYDKYLKHISGIFGEENVIPYVFERAQMSDGPFGEFCKKLGIDGYHDFPIAQNTNSSLNPAQSEFLRNLPLIEATPSFKGLLAKAAEAITAREAQSSLMMSHDVRQQILQEYESGNRQVAQKYFGRSELFLESLPSKEVKVSMPELPASSSELIEDFVIPFVEYLIEDNNKNKQS